MMIQVDADNADADADDNYDADDDGADDGLRNNMLVGDQRGGGNDAEEIGLEDCSLLLNDHLDVKHFWGAFETYFGRLLASVK